MQSVNGPLRRVLLSAGSGRQGPEPPGPASVLHQCEQLERDGEKQFLSGALATMQRSAVRSDEELSAARRAAEQLQRQLEEEQRRAQLQQDLHRQQMEDMRRQLSDARAARCDEGGEQLHGGHLRALLEPLRHLPSLGWGGKQSCVEFHSGWGMADERLTFCQRHGQQAHRQRVLCMVLPNPVPPPPT